MSAGNREPMRIEDVTQRIEEMIADGTLQPAEHLVEEEMAERIGTTRSMMRLAMQRLEAQGVIVRERNRGARVRPISEDEAVELLEIRAALEAIVARNAALKATPSDIGGLKELIIQMREHLASDDFIAYGKASVEMHESINLIARHVTAERYLSLIRAAFHRFHYWSIFQPGRARESLEEHERLVRAISANDQNAAQVAAVEHMSQAITNLRRAIETSRRKGIPLKPRRRSPAADD